MNNSKFDAAVTTASAIGLEFSDSIKPSQPSHSSLPTVVEGVSLHKAFTNPSQTNSKSNNKSSKRDNKDNKTGSDLAQNEMANKLRLMLSNILALDEITEEWVSRVNNQIWHPMTKIRAESLIEEKLETIKPRYAASYLGSVVRLLKTRLIAPPWESDRNLLPMDNGIFNIKQNRLMDYGSQFFNWQLPFSYSKKAKCPTIDAWLKVATQNNDEIAHFLMCWAKAVVTGRADLQKYLEIVGHGGTGKGTYTRILTSLVGDVNTVVTDLSSLEKNRFESASLYGKRLAVISDAAHWGGEVSALKAITGNDPLRYERKGIQTGQPFIFGGMVLIASNENIQTTDYTSGLSRRRITVPFNHIISEEEKSKYPNFEQSLQDELSGLFNKLMLITDTEVTQAIRHPCQAIQDAKHEAELDTNPLLSWMCDYLIQCDDGEESQVGSLFSGEAIGNLEQLYPHYVDYCGRHGRKPKALNRFSHLIVDNCVSRGVPTKKHRQGGTGRTIIKNLRLKLGHESEKSLFVKAKCSTGRTSDECEGCEGHFATSKYTQLILRENYGHRNQQTIKNNSR